MQGMTRADLITALADRFRNLTTKDTEISVKLILDSIGTALLTAIALKFVVLEALVQITARPA